MGYYYIFKKNFFICKSGCQGFDHKLHSGVALQLQLMDKLYRYLIEVARDEIKATSIRDSR